MGLLDSLLQEMIECREIVDNVKAEAKEQIRIEEKMEGHGCKECMDLQAEFVKNPGGKPPRRVGLIIAGVVGGLGLGVTALTVPFLLPALRRVCLPFVPATTTQVENVMTALRGKGGTLVDIGSGDGRIVLEAARRGFQSHGVELNRVLVLYSRYAAVRAGLRGQATFARQDLWKSDMSKYDNVVIFGVEQMMEKLEKKLKEGSTVVACRFQFPSWKPVGEVGEGV